MKQLIGHIDPGTAHCVSDYPYGFVLTTDMYYWIETRKGFGQRFMSMTRNPKTGRLNKAKVSTYAECVVMFIDDATGHVDHACLTQYSGEKELIAFKEKYALDEYQAALITRWIAAHVALRERKAERKLLAA